MTSNRKLNWMDGIVGGLIHFAARRAPDLLRLHAERLAALLAAYDYPFAGCLSTRGRVLRLRGRPEH